MGLPCGGSMTQKRSFCSMIKVVVVDDHPVVRFGVVRIIEDQTDMQVVGEASDGNEAIDLLDELGCDLVILDINMPNRNGFDTLRELLYRDPTLKVLILSAYREEDHAVRYLKAGANGYVSKGGNPADLLHAIRRIAEGGRYVSPRVAEQLVLAVSGNNDNKAHESLSEREFQVLSYIARGKTVSEIAGALNLSVKTISTYRSRLLEKMDLSNNAEATYYAIKNGLVD